jgi:hypothetical protein
VLRELPADSTIDDAVENLMVVSRIGRVFHESVGAGAERDEEERW